MQLVIAEKPSVAAALAKVLGAKSRQDGYIAGGGWLVSWCVGHLVELAPADAYDPRYSKWNYSDLPILPDPWQFRVLPDTRKQFKIISSLLNDDRISSIVCATDAGREGELIFRLTYKLCGCKKPVKRLWISSMEESAIRKGFDNLLDSQNYDNLYHAALCRAKADWLIGINGTRLFSTLYQGKTLNVGRVVTPALALLAERESAIEGFKKEKFYTVELDMQKFRAVSEKITSKTDAGKLRDACLGKTAVVKSVARKNKTEHPPKLYDLTTLQREANRLFDFTAQQTLEYLQALYEKRLATYPRTDSRYLTEDMKAAVPNLCSVAAAALPFIDFGLPSVNISPIIDNSKVSDHHAVIPTAEIANADLTALPTGERNILYLISARLLCAVSEPHIYAETIVTLECGGASFSTKGYTEISAGWKDIEQALLTMFSRRTKWEETVRALPELFERQRLENADAAVKSGTTTPPAHFTEDTLLLAMEQAGAEEFAKLEDVERKGLGTPATRAGVIEKLVRSGFAERKKKQFLPTERGLDLIRVMPEQLKSAKLTAEWEERLGAVERGELSPDVFMAGITEMVTDMVKTYAHVSTAAAVLSPSKNTAIGVCPRCGKDVIEGKKSFFCKGYYDTPSCEFALWKNGRFFAVKRKELTRTDAVSLLKHGRVHMTGLYSEKKGVFYDATVVLSDTGGKHIHFKLEFDKNKGGKL